MIKSLLSSIKKMTTSDNRYDIDDFFSQIQEKKNNINKSKIMKESVNNKTDNMFDEKFNEKNTLPNFSSIENHSFIDIVCKEDPNLNSNDSIIFKITENDKILDNLNIKVKNNVLIIFNTNHSLLNSLNHLSTKIKLEIIVKSLNNFSNFSIGDAHIECQLNGKIVQKGTGNIHIKSSQAHSIESTYIGNIIIEEQNSKKLYINSSSTGNITIKNGMIDNLKSYTTSIGNLNIGATIESLTTRNKGTGNQKFKNVTSYADITLNSIGNIQLSGEASNHCKIYSTGVGNVHVSELHSKLLDIYNTGIGNIQLDGYAEESTIISEGMGDIKAKKLEIYKLNINHTGPGNVKYTQINEPKNKIKSVFNNKKIKPFNEESIIDSDIFENVTLKLNDNNVEPENELTTTPNNNEENETKTREEKKILSRKRRFK